MFSKVYKQKFFSSPAKGKKAQVLENTRLFRKLAFKGSPRNSVIRIGPGYRAGQKNVMVAFPGHARAYPRTYPDTRIPKKKTFNVFKYLCPKG